MGQKPRLYLRTTIRPSLSAGPRTGVELLAMPAADLRADLERLAIENAFLVLEPAPAPGGAGQGDPYLSDVAQPVSLVRHLQEQIACMGLPEPVATLAAYLATALDGRGLLTESDDELAAETAADAETVAAARAALQACDPTGVGARDLGECICLQLIEEGESAARAASIHAALPALAEGRFAAAARALGESEAEARALAARIARLNPDPAAAFDAGGAAPMAPELLVTREAGGRLVVTLLDDPAARLRLDEGLAGRARATGDAATRDFVAAQLAAARRVCSAARFRAHTLRAVGEAIVEAQSAHFLGRARAPGPLSRAAVAARLGLHPSTVGRAVRGRALLFEGRTRPLSDYFPAALEAGSGETGAGEGGISSAEIQARMRDIVSAETVDTVLSDDDIAHYLREGGVDIARRTVAKYRKCLSIPNSSDRRRRLARRARLGAAGVRE
ncbi:hypothetical protein DLJ49_06310 [Rhodovulum sp. 12E13]|uniref:RNA polymerase factor sigma-54 n=1 Tax=Rhodovulum sp. 12E13 TaxID=2203891 RepID=UPI000E153F19|nr:hypothetical protein [Rhodovulum sp. 12E13]RDC73726.1 hypothetical protein DLJ49_06310 [Rhodovulum sp. 12E13]